MVKVATRLRFELAIAELPPLTIQTYAPERYPKGHPKGGQFKPKKGGKDAPSDAPSGADDGGGEGGILSKAKAAIATRLKAIAQKLGFTKSEAQLEAEQLGIDLPKGFKLAGGRTGTIGKVESKINEREDFDDEKSVSIDGKSFKARFERTSYGGQLVDGPRAKGIGFFSEVSGDSEADDYFEVHSVTSSLNQVKRRDDKALSGHIKGGGKAHTFAFLVDDSFDQSAFETPEMANQLMKTVKHDFNRAMGAVKDNEIVIVKPHKKDGRGAAREAAYRRMGFSRADAKTGSMYAIKKGNKLYPITTS